MFDPNAPQYGRHAMPEPQYPPPAPPKRRSLAWVWALLALLAVGATVAVVVFATKSGSGSGSPTPEPTQDGYYTAADLEPDVLSTSNEKLSDNGSDLTATDVNCVDTAVKREWRCLITLSDDDTVSIVVNVASDYQSWVSHGSGN